MDLDNILTYKKYKRVFFTKRTPDIISEIRSLGENVCDWKIKSDYLTLALNAFDYGYIYYDKEDNDKVKGFSLFKVNNIDNPNLARIYIKLICGRGLGKLIFDDIERYAISKNIRKIVLIPINTIMEEYYKTKYGYTNKIYNKQLKTYVLPKTINNNIIQLSYHKNTPKTTHTTRKHTRYTNTINRRRTRRALTIRDACAEKDTTEAVTPDQAQAPQ